MVPWSFETLGLVGVVLCCGALVREMFLYNQGYTFNVFFGTSGGLCDLLCNSCDGLHRQ